MQTWAQEETTTRERFVSREPDRSAAGSTVGAARFKTDFRSFSLCSPLAPKKETPPH